MKAPTGSISITPLRVGQSLRQFTMPSINTCVKAASPMAEAAIVKRSMSIASSLVCRRGIADLVGVDDPVRVIFTYSGTDAVNTAIFGLVRPGDHVVTTVCDHNSVLRPLRFLHETAGVTVTYVPCDSEGFVSPDDVRTALRPNTRLVAVVHGSNVTGALQPVEAIGEVVSEHGAYYLIDAAQSLGEVPLTMQSSQADLIAAPGHKGLLGPLGTGVLCLSERVAGELKPFRFGGTGTSSDEDRQPDELPYKFEPGNLNIVGDGRAAWRLWSFSANEASLPFRPTISALAVRLLDGLHEIAGVKIHGPQTGNSRTSVVSFTLDGYDPQELAAVLEMTAGDRVSVGTSLCPTNARGARHVGARWHGAAESRLGDDRRRDRCHPRRDRACRRGCHSLNSPNVNHGRPSCPKPT